MNKLFEALISIGFTDKEAQEQIKGLEKAIEKSLSEKITDNDLNNSEKKLDFLREIATEIMNGYVEAVTKNLTPVKRESFFSIISES